MVDQIDSFKYHFRDLPDEFWEGLLQVRNYLLRDQRFVNRIYGDPFNGDALRNAFQCVDYYFDLCYWNVIHES